MKTPLTYRQKLMPRTVETCPHRKAGHRGAGAATAACGILEEVFRESRIDPGTVARDACEACCRSFPPSAATWSPAVASLIYERASKAAQTASGQDLEGLRRLCETALAGLDVVYTEPVPVAAASFDPGRPLADIVPPPRVRHGARVRQWAVGVTTAPRLQPTLEPCLESLVRAGWRTPHLFVDSAVRLPPQFSHLPGTLRDARIGAWPNYYLALAELLLRHPHADAYLIAQDDALFYDRQSLPEYLEQVLWPSRPPALVSLYSAPADCGFRPGWHSLPGSCSTGPVAMVFSRELAKSFLADAAVIEHRWSPDPVAAAALGHVVGHWARDCGIPLWLPTPSLVQHIGDTSTLWPRARALGHRRAGWFAGDREKTA